MKFPVRSSSNTTHLAVQYLRMSTTVQEQSIEIQQELISAYAVSKGLEVIDTYVDDGKSGLQLQNRPGLRKLLLDVQQPGRAFSKVLVLDIGRWGRFQNADEAAYYEFHCQLNGVQLIYVAEPFLNDHSAISSMLKSMKRVMAAEYSRELGVKTRAGQERVFRAGFSPSHNVHLGYRRQVVSPDLKRCVVLEPGERKGVQSDRIRVVLGPRSEQNLVKRIFRLYAETDININELVRQLNADGHRMPDGRELSQSVVAAVLTNQIYLGTAVWGATSTILKSPRRLSPENTLHLPGIVPQLVSERMFTKVQAKLVRRRQKFKGPEQMLKELAEAVAKHGFITCRYFNAYGLASDASYANNFGSVGNAYRLIGHNHKPQNIDACRRSRQASKAFLHEVASFLGEYGAQVSFNNKKRQIQINGWVLRLYVSSPVDQGNRSIWSVRPTPPGECDLILVVRLETDGTTLDYHLVHSGECHQFPKTMWRDGPPSAQRFRIDDLTPLALLRL